MTTPTLVRSPRRLVGLLLAVGLAALVGALGVAVGGTGAGAATRHTHRTALRADTGGTGSAVTASRTVERTYLDNGTTTVVDKRHVTLTVGQTHDLRTLQLIHVSWTGAHPTGGLVPDVNSDLAMNEEYPMLLLECRGTASTVSPQTCWTQYADERFDYGYTNEPAWRSDVDATPADRQPIVGAPSTLNAACSNILLGTHTQHWLPFVGANGAVYRGGPFGCAGQPAEATATNLSTSSLPSNETFGVSDAKGDGQANFDIFTSEDHQSLGCSQTTACSLVAVPIEGISCDAGGEKLPAGEQPSGSNLAQATANCENTGNFTAGEALPTGDSGSPAVDGSLWWSASNWANRIVVPLTFAPPDDACSLASSGDPVDVFGSELMTQTSLQWAPHFCLNSKLFDLNHVQTPEPEARSLLAEGGITAAYSSYPPSPGFTTPTVQAPVAATGFGIAYDVDGPNGLQVGTLRLDARLLAKLLTESYPDISPIKDTDPALANNPLNITDDPEFKALNPDIPVSAADAAATLFVVNSDSDVMSALTSYINADPEARAWLNGKPDPWGMTVNPAYKNIALPVDNWPLLDTYEPKAIYQPGKNDCLAIDPSPYLPLVAAPTARLATIGLDMEFALSPSQTTCVLPSPIPGSTAGAKLVADGRQAAGHLMMFGLVSLGDAAREGLSLASLETYTAPSAATQFTDTSGRTFVAPSTASLRAAAQSLQPDAKTGVWPIDYTALRSAAHEDAYPGTMLVYADVPTSGLSHSMADDYGKLLFFASKAGQHAGTAVGQLAAGFLPLDAANGLTNLSSYTARSAVAVSEQKGALPSMTSTAFPTSVPVTRPARTSGAHSSTGGSGSSGFGGTSGDGSTGTGTGTTHATGPRAGHTAKASTAPAPKSTAPAETPVAEKTPESGSAFGRLLLPGLLVLALVAGVAAGVVGLVTGLKTR